MAPLPRGEPEHEDVGAAGHSLRSCRSYSSGKVRNELSTTVTAPLIRPQRPLPEGTGPDIGAFEHPWLPVVPPTLFDGLEYIASYPDLIEALTGRGATADSSPSTEQAAVDATRVRAATARAILM